MPVANYGCNMPVTVERREHRLRKSLAAFAWALGCYYYGAIYKMRKYIPFLFMFGFTVFLTCVARDLCLKFPSEYGPMWVLVALSGVAAVGLGVYAISED